MKFHSEAFNHDQPEKIGVLLVNLGSPDKPDTVGIRRFLKEFLSDHRVIEIPGFIWQIILRLFILPLRPKKLVPAYESIWTEDGAPLIAIARKQKDSLETWFENNEKLNPHFVLAMRYGSPDIRSALVELAQNNARKILVVPTYPQYSGSTTASIFDAITKELQQWRWVPELRFINQYADQAEYIDALAESVRQHWHTQPKGEKLLMSFHGLPKAYLLKGDPYYCQCQKTARLLAEKLELQANEWQITFQSRFGKAEWLKPYTSETLTKLAKQGIQSVDVICPGFAIDCLETLEEIAVENRDVFLNAGGQQYSYIPALNDSEVNIRAMAALIKQHTQGWEIVSDSEALGSRNQRYKKVEADYD
jgi:ferrochelatase